MSNTDVLIDFLNEMWVLQYYKIVIAMVIFWLIYLKIKNACLVDFGWVFNHLLLGVALYLTNCIDQLYWKPLVYVSLLFIWFCRLGGFLLIYRILPGHEDPRYAKLQQERNINPVIYFFVNYQLQGFLVMWTGVPLYFVFRANDQINYIVLSISIFLIVTGIIFEAVSDYQLQKYKKSKYLARKAPDYTKLNEQSSSQNLDIFQGGLWKKSRHPNLFFELVTWVGFAVAGLNDYISILGFLGPLILYIIMDQLTLPLTEKHMRDTRGEAFEDFCKKTNKFIPI